MPKRDEIALSIVVTPMSGAAFLHRCLDALAPQLLAQDIEVIVPFDDTVTGIGQVEDTFPQVTFLNMGRVKTRAIPDTQTAVHELLDRRTAEALKVARGAVIALTHDYAIPDCRWCEQVIKAHQLPYGAIGGAVEHVGRGARNWALYLQDFGRYQPPLDEGPVGYLTDVNVSYKREAIESVRHLWQDRYKETTVNQAFAKRGDILWRRPQMIVRLDRGPVSFRDALVERRAWGRLFGSMRTEEMRPIMRLGYVVAGGAIPWVLLGRIVSHSCRNRRDRFQQLMCIPQAAAFVCSWSFGECLAYLTGHE